MFINLSYIYRDIRIAYIAKDCDFLVFHRYLTQYVTPLKFGGGMGRVKIVVVHNRLESRLLAFRSLTRAFPFFIITHPSLILVLACIARIPRKWTYNLPHAFPQPFPSRRFVPREFLGIDADADADVDEDESTASRRPSPHPLRIRRQREVCDSPCAAWSQLHRKKR